MDSMIAGIQILVVIQILSICLIIYTLIWLSEVTVFNFFDKQSLLSLITK